MVSSSNCYSWGNCSSFYSNLRITDFKIVRIFVICLVTLPFQPVVLQFIFSTTFFLLFQFFLIDFFLVARISFSFVNISQVLTKWSVANLPFFFLRARKLRTFNFMDKSSFQGNFIFLMAKQLWSVALFFCSKCV